MGAKPSCIEKCAPKSGPVATVAPMTTIKRLEVNVRTGHAGRLTGHAGRVTERSSFFATLDVKLARRHLPTANEPGEETSSDLYAAIFISGREQLHEVTHAVPRTLVPDWSFQGTISDVTEAEVSNEHLEVHLWDPDVSRDSPLGLVSIPLARLELGGGAVYKLQPTEQLGGGTTYKLQPTEQSMEGQRETIMGLGELTVEPRLTVLGSTVVHLLGASHVPCLFALNRSLVQPYAAVWLADESLTPLSERSVWPTQPAGTYAPVWNSAHALQLFEPEADLKHALLCIELWDDDGVLGPNLIGHARAPLSSFGTEPFVALPLTPSALVQSPGSSSAEFRQLSPGSSSAESRPLSPGSSSAEFRQLSPGCSSAEFRQLSPGCSSAESRQLSRGSVAESSSASAAAATAPSAGVVPSPPTDDEDTAARGASHFIKWGVHSLTESISPTLMAPLPPCTVQLRLLPRSRCPRRKRLYVVRHGESVWNQGQKDLNLVALYSQVDHPLSVLGREQAEGLALKLAQAASAPAADSEAALLRDLCGAKLILCSPLTRALQTCLIALGHACNLRSPGRHVHLAPNAREKRNHGAVDSIGCAIGEAEVRARLMQTTAELYEGDADAASRAVGGIELEDLEVRQRWWCTSPAESELEVHQRLAEFVRQIQYASEETIVLVGHSHWIRELLREYLHASVGRRDPEFAKRLASRKLSNCGVARLAFDFDESDETPITDVQLLCGTGLVK